MSVEKAEEILRLQNKNGNGSWHDYVTRFEILELLESMRDLDGEKGVFPDGCHHDFSRESHVYEGIKVCKFCGMHEHEPIPSGYWFIEPKFEWINSEVGREEYHKRKSVGNCFSTEAEAMEKLSKLTGGKDE